MGPKVLKLFLKILKKFLNFLNSPLPLDQCLVHARGYFRLSRLLGRKTRDCCTWSLNLPQGTRVKSSILQIYERRMHVPQGLWPDLACKTNARVNEMNHAYPAGTPTPDGLVDAA